MVLTAGGPCVGQARRKNQEPAELCASVSAHKWYTGPFCKNCYERNQTESRKHPKLARTEDAPAESGGDIPLVCLSVSAARLSVIPRTLVDRSNPPPEPDDDEGDEGVRPRRCLRLVQVRVRRRWCAAPRSEVGAAARSGAGRRLEGGGSEVGGEAEEGQQ
mmetsp:Transcript_9172/g.21743  ORF Transcript_9172/g.21743 Transcript_9172/m.21743 type:complete len:161 (+) Transcript_9172:160-642(+)